MEHARKMVLVPEENLLQMDTRHQTVSDGNIVRTPEAQALTVALSRLDTEMNEILNSNAYKDEREKWTAYMTVLQRYLHFVDNERSQQYYALLKTKKKKEEEEHGVHKDADNERKEHTSRMNDSIIIETVPQKFRTKARLLLRRLHSAPTSTFSWDDAGVVSMKGRPIKDSNIVDLVNDAMRARKTASPAGRKAFARLLRTIQAPREFIGNDAVWHASRANSTLQEGQTNGDGSTSATTSNEEVEEEEEDANSTDHSEFFSGSESTSKQSRVIQSGTGRHNNKKKRVTWISLKL